MALTFWGIMHLLYAAILVLYGCKWFMFKTAYRITFHPARIKICTDYDQLIKSFTHYQG